jgi:nucleoside-diphosphate-sugar epimerase
MNVLLVGATGILGRNVVPRLLERGYHVRAVVRGDEQARFLEQIGVEPVPGNLLDRKSLEVAARGMQAALHLALPGENQQDGNLSHRLQLEGTGNLIEALRQNGVKRYIQQSISLVYGEKGAELVDESTSLEETPLNQSAIRMEKLVRESELDWIILRSGLFYGPGTGREERWWQSARQGRLIVPGDGSDLVSLVHVLDMARAVVAATEQAPAHSIYNIADDEPVQVRELFRYVAAQAGRAAPPDGGPRFLPSLGVRNLKAQIQLGWRPVYPGYQTGLAYGAFAAAGNREMSLTASPRLADQAQTEAIL